MALWHWKYELVEYLPKLSNEEVKPMAKDNKKELLEAAIYRNTSKQKLKQNSWKLTAKEFIPQQNWRL